MAWSECGGIFSRVAWAPLPCPVTMASTACSTGVYPTFTAVCLAAIKASIIPGPSSAGQTVQSTCALPATAASRPHDRTDLTEASAPASQCPISASCACPPRRAHAPFSRRCRTVARLTAASRVTFRDGGRGARGCDGAAGVARGGSGAGGQNQQLLQNQSPRSIHERDHEALLMRGAGLLSRLNSLKRRGGYKRTTTLPLTNPDADFSAACLARRPGTHGEADCIPVPPKHE